MEGWAIIGLRDDRADVGGGDDAPHTGNGRSRLRVSMRRCGRAVRCCENLLGEQHAGQANVVDGTLAAPVTLARASTRGTDRPI